jgi:hypothetical protein
MNKLTFRLTIALLTFIIGVAATTVWLINRPSKTIVMPAGKWEANFFRIIDKRTEAANLPSLRTVNLPNGDLEVRIWVITGLNGEDGIILRRSSSQWSALYLHGIFDHYPPAKFHEQRNLEAPKSGWDKMWQRLVEAGILTLPDASLIGCNTYGLDGIGYVVEVNTNKTRTYMYDNPQDAKCSEAKRMMEIIEILFDEFSLYQHPE